MIVDHTGAVLFPQLEVLRMIGRAAFPLYAFCMAQGCMHTRSGGALTLRLFAAALLTEPVFDAALYGGGAAGFIINMRHQNVLFTLLLGALACFAIKAADGAAATLNVWARRALMALAPLPFAAAGELICCDYGAAGVLAVAAFYLAGSYGQNETSAAVCLTLACWLYWGAPYYLIFAALAAVIILAYNKKPGPRLRWLFYASYPGHLLILYLLRLMLH